MEMNKYRQFKAKKSVTLNRLGPNTFQVVKKRFDPDEGVELPPEVVGCNREGVEAHIAQIEKGIESATADRDSLKELLDDMTASDAAAGTPQT